jgi:glycerophosphoryl diester phosphodiesterase
MLDDVGRILVHGHRGARAILPENTLAGFEYAIDAGADAIELDVAVTRDDVLVVSHDPVLNPGICRGPAGSRVIRELTLAQLQQWDCGSATRRRFRRQQPAPGARVPTLDQVFALHSRGDFQFNVEVKSYPDRPVLTPPPEEYALMVLAAIRSHPVASRVMVQSFDFRILRAMKRLAPEIRLSVLFELGIRGFVQEARRAESEMVGPYHRLVTTRRVASAHAAGIQVIPWTANTPQAWARLLRAGVDGIITDDPAALIRFLEERGLR